MISAVLGVDRRLWRATGGFDGEFVGYGGEDWDFAWRAWLAGAQLAVRAGGGGLARRPGRSRARAPTVAVKNAECLRLAQTIALPSVRGTGLVLEQPEIVVRYLGPTTGTAADAAVVACVAGLLDETDAAVWFPRVLGRTRIPDGAAAAAAGDPRVHAGDVPPASWTGPGIRCGWHARCG